MAQPPCLSATTTTLAARKRPISEKKKITSRKSSTPWLMAVKWVRKLNDDTALISVSGAQKRKRSSTSGAPETVKRKHTTTVTTKAITWLAVVAEMQAPI